MTDQKMKVLRQTKLRPDGTINVTVNIPATHKLVMVRDTPLVHQVEVHEERYYQLGQIEDVVAAHVLTDAVEVYWCSVTQKWVEA